MDLLLQGSILHRALAEWTRAPLLGAAILDQVFEEECARRRVPEGYRTEAVRLELMRNFRGFLDDTQFGLRGWSTRVEEKFSYALNPLVSITGRIDRLNVGIDTGPANQALVIDYKYSAGNKIKERVDDTGDGHLVQGGLYLAAAARTFGLDPVGMLFCGLKKDVTWDGWHVSVPGLESLGTKCTREALRGLMEDAESAAVRVHEAITSGDIAVRPADPRKCQWCDFRDICRVESAALVTGSFVILSDDQRRAVERIGQDVCVVAGPGSGKTRVLTERFAWLVEKQSVDPARILAITFTEKAANEIKSRLIRRFAARPELRESIERAWVSTIHGFCARVLQENAIRAGLPPDFKVLDQPAADRLAREAAEASLDAMYREQPDQMRRLLEALDLSTQDNGRQPDLAESLLDVYESMRLSGITEIPAATRTPDCLTAARDLVSSLVNGPPPRGAEGPRLREWAAEFLAHPNLELLGRFDFSLNRVGRNPAATQLKQEALPALKAQWIGEWYADLHDLLKAAIARVGATYRARKRQESAVDFADLEEFTVALLESDDEVRRQVSGRFEQVLMDELQDTNRLQWRLVNLLRTSFFGVGDINQSIYGFRYADPDVFAEYRDALRSSGAEIDELKENHRSRAEILAAVSAVLDGQAGIEARPLEAHAKFEPVGVAVERLVGRGENAAEAEAALVAARIRQFVDRGEFQFRDIAVLVRTLSSTAPFERAFDRLNIPFLLTGGRTFLEARETRDLLALLAALVNPLDEIPLVGVLRGPLVGLSDRQIYQMGREGWRTEFEERFGRVRELAGFIAPDRLIAMALDQCGYTRGLADRSRANVEKLLAWLRREFRDRPRPLAEMLEDLEALRWTQSVAEAPPPEAGDVVRMMTIHAAKGLEFPVVFVSALHRSPDRRKPVIAVSGSAGLGVKWRHPLTGEGHSDSVHLALIEQMDLREKAEENRLLYVAMTRAQDRLILSHAEGKRSSPWQKLAEPAVPESAASRADTTPEPAE